jgi:hypothetical protein
MHFVHFVQNASFLRFQIPLKKFERSGHRPLVWLSSFGLATARYPVDVFHVDGNKNNVSVYNLKTICSNCQRLKSTQELGWSIGDLEVDA